MHAASLDRFDISELICMAHVSLVIRDTKDRFLIL